MITISKDWTDEERLKIISVIASGIQKDIPAGRYGAVLEEDERGIPTKCRPNMQSILELVALPAEYLEAQRAGIEEFLESLAKGDPEIEKLFSKPLAEARKDVETFFSEFG